VRSGRTRSSGLREQPEPADLLTIFDRVGAMGELVADDELPASPGLSGKHFVEVQSASGWSARIEFRVRPETVEVWRHSPGGAAYLSGIFRRVTLRIWLANPTVVPLIKDEVILSLDRSVDDVGRVALSLADVSAWTLTLESLGELRFLVGA
jgi:hypothetical protein